MGTFCPYCDAEIEAAILKEYIGDYPEEIDDFFCPECGGEMDINIESIPVFTATAKITTHKPE